MRRLLGDDCALMVEAHYWIIRKSCAGLWAEQTLMTQVGFGSDF